VNGVSGDQRVPARDGAGQAQTGKAFAFPGSTLNGCNDSQVCPATTDVPLERHFYLHRAGSRVLRQERAAPIIIPGMQKPHCDAFSSKNAACRARVCGVVPSPSLVTMSQPSTAPIEFAQEGVSRHGRECAAHD
jgi:hypothetical protein